MKRIDNEYPAREEYPPLPDELSAPCEDAEFRPPREDSEFTPPYSAAELNSPAAEREFTPPGMGGTNGGASKRRRYLRGMLFGAAALVMVGLLFAPPRDRASAVHETSVPSPAETVYTPSTETPLPSPTPEPTPEPTPVTKVPSIELSFFYFSHEHHGTVLMSNVDALHSVYVSVREKTLDKLVYEYYLTENEIKSGRFELPMLSTGDYYMENMDAIDAANAWPEFELSVTAWYENEAGDGEDVMTLTAQAEFEMGIGLGYMSPDDTWSDYIPPDSFYVMPWEETEEISFVINDPDAVTDPTVISVDLSCNGHHASPEEYEEVIEKSEYTLIDSETGERTPTVGYTKELILRRPDWMPEEGVLHVHIVQMLASTGELWIRDYDYDYS